ncbi:hypothetical protein JSY14_08230 [Brachybacterium sp. EF45031]|nr:hypothetical protein [Brachybacterium sillae]MCS6712006.1 hypothetical protein [Brachybacterium sillae]
MPNNTDTPQNESQDQTNEVTATEKPDVSRLTRRLDHMVPEPKVISED